MWDVIAGAASKSPLFNADKAKENEYRRAQGLKKKDTVKIYSLARTQQGKLTSFSYQTASVKAQSLQQEAYRVQSKIRTVERSVLSAGEKSRKIRALRGQLEYVNCKLNAAIADTPRHYVIIEPV
jgi:hypothetical protein